MSEVKAMNDDNWIIRTARQVQREYDALPDWQKIPIQDCGEDSTIMEPAEFEDER